MRRVRHLAAFVCFTVLAAAAHAADRPTTNPTTRPGLDGTWLIDDCSVHMGSPMIRTNLVLRDGHFAFNNYWGLSHPWAGTYTVDGSRNVDLHTEPFQYFRDTRPAVTLHGIYKLDGDRLTVCFPLNAYAPRPAGFKAADGVALTTLVQADPDYAGFPARVTVTVTDPAGHPVAGANVFEYAEKGYAIIKRPDGKRVWDKTHPFMWRDSVLGTTGPDGTATIDQKEFVPRDSTMPCGGRDPATGQVGIAIPTPASVRHGTLAIRLHPPRTVRGTITCRALSDAGTPVPWRAAYLSAGEVRPLFCYSPDGSFDFHVPPGTYTLYAYSSDVGEAPVQTVVVPADGTADIVLPPIDLIPSALLALIGHPAPELAGVEGWRGTPTKLADLKGKLVLLDFGGTWCGSCVAEMPALMRVADKYKDKGLAVVGVNADIDGTADTPAHLQARMDPLIAGPWHGAGPGVPDRPGRRPADTRPTRTAAGRVRGPVLPDDDRDRPRRPGPRGTHAPGGSSPTCPTMTPPPSTGRSRSCSPPPDPGRTGVRPSRTPAPARAIPENPR